MIGPLVDVVSWVNPVDWIDWAIVASYNVNQFVLSQFEKRGFWEWLLFFFPFVIFGEMPRYVLPSILYPIAKFFMLEKNNDAEQEAFLASTPKVSVIVAGMNEEDVIRNTIESLLELSYPNVETIVIDDCSSDNMYLIAKEYADRGQIRLFRNIAETGRTGRPTATNLGVRVATGEFIISVDADTTYDRDIIQKMIGPFCDPRVGAVAGNIKIRNLKAGVVPALQAVEYFISIGLWKRWTTLLGMTMQASGAFGAFRREPVKNFYGWDAELAEDADISLKLKKLGWKIAFAPHAISMTTAPDSLYQLSRQRFRWDQGALRTYFHKHGDLMLFWRFPWKNFVEMAQEYIMTVGATYLYLFYFIYMVIYRFKLLLLVIFLCYFIYLAFTFVALTVAIYYSERDDEWHLLWYSFLVPFYKSWFRVVRMYALTMELLRWKYENGYLPASAWDNTPKW